MSWGTGTGWGGTGGSSGPGSGATAGPPVLGDVLIVCMTEGINSGGNIQIASNGSTFIYDGNFENSIDFDLLGFEEDFSTLVLVYDGTSWLATIHAPLEQVSMAMQTLWNAGSPPGYAYVSTSNGNTIPLGTEFVFTENNQVITMMSG